MEQSRQAATEAGLLPPLRHSDEIIWTAFTDAEPSPGNAYWRRGTDIGLLTRHVRPDIGSSPCLLRVNEVWTCCSTAEGATLSGVAPRANLVSVKVLDDDGTTASSVILDVVDNVCQINSGGEDLRPHGVNLSLGCPWPPTEFAAGQVDFNADGTLDTATGSGDGGLSAAVNAGGITDLFVMCHGWNDCVEPATRSSSGLAPSACRQSITRPHPRRCRAVAHGRSRSCRAEKRSVPCGVRSRRR